MTEKDKKKIKTKKDNKKIRIQIKKKKLTPIPCSINYIIPL